MERAQLMKSEWKRMRLLKPPESVRWSPPRSSPFFYSILPFLLLLQLSPPLPAGAPLACAPPRTSNVFGVHLYRSSHVVKCHHIAIWPKKENCLLMPQSVKWAIKTHSTAAFTHLRTTWSRMMELDLVSAGLLLDAAPPPNPHVWVGGQQNLH